MATIQNSNLNYTGLVQKYIGTAYDKVARVADSIDNVDLVSGSIEDGTFQYVVDNMDAILNVVAKIEAFNSIYYGIYTERPVQDPYGNPMDIGDMYYNETENQLYVYMGKYFTDECDITTIIGGEWLPVGSCQNTSEVIVVTSDNITRGNVLDLTYLYVPEQGNLEVYVNNIRQYSTYTSVTLGSYIEVNGSSIQFLNGRVHDGDGGLKSLVEGDEVLVSIGTQVANIRYQLDVEIGRYVTEVANEQIITLPPSEQSPDGMLYVLGSNNLEVYVKDNQHSRELQMIGVDYLEMDPGRIQMIVPLPQYAELIFKKGKVVSTKSCEQPVLMMPTKPTEIYYEPGKFWYNTSTGRLSILYKDTDSLQWVDISEEHTVIHDTFIPPPSPPPVLTNATVFQPLQPEPSLFAEGTLWFNTGTGELNILYADKGDREPEAGFGPSPQWVKVSTQ